MKWLSIEEQGVSLLNLDWAIMWVVPNKTHLRSGEGFQSIGTFCTETQRWFFENIYSVDRAGYRVTHYCLVPELGDPNIPTEEEPND